MKMLETLEEARARSYIMSVFAVSCFNEIDRIFADIDELCTEEIAAELLARTVTRAADDRPRFGLPPCEETPSA